MDCGLGGRGGADLMPITGEAYFGGGLLDAVDATGAGELE